MLETETTRMMAHYPIPLTYFDITDMKLQPMQWLRHKIARDRLIFVDIYGIDYECAARNVGLACTIDTKLIISFLLACTSNWM